MKHKHSFCLSHRNAVIVSSSEAFVGENERVFYTYTLKHSDQITVSVCSVAWLLLRLVYLWLLI